MLSSLPRQTIHKNHNGFFSPERAWLCAARRLAAKLGLVPTSADLSSCTYTVAGATKGNSS